MHILLCGERQVGKSTLIRRLLQENRLPVYGFMTRMERTEPPYPVYIHPAGEPVENRVYGRENLVGTCDSRCRELLEAHRTQLDAVAQYLLEHETMERDAFLKVFGETEPSEEA